MPSALILELQPQQAATVSAGTNRAVHAWLLNQIEAAAPELAVDLHREGTLRPFTTAFAPPQTINRGPISIEPEQHLALRISLLSSELETLAATWSAAGLGELILDGMRWQVSRIVRSNEEHPWAGQISYEQLITEAMSRAASLDGRWMLEFATPLTFRQRGKNQPLPTADLVFGSLLERWNRLAPMPLPETLRATVDEQVAVSKVELRSVAMPTKGGALQVGVVGRCGYTLTGRDRSQVGALDLLSRFAFYSSIGAGVTRGFGLSRPLEQRPARPRQPAHNGRRQSDAIAE